MWNILWPENDIFDKTNYEKLLFLKHILSNFYWNIQFYHMNGIFLTKNRLMFESTNECLIKHLKGFELEIWFLTFKITFWLKKLFFDKNSFDHNSYDFLSIWHINTTDRRGILLRIFVENFYFSKNCHFQNKNPQNVFLPTPGIGCGRGFAAATTQRYILKRYISINSLKIYL